MKLAPAPVLETERLKLRPYKVEDFEAYAALYQSERSQYMNGPIEKHLFSGRTLVMPTFILGVSVRDVCKPAYHLSARQWRLDHASRRGVRQV